MNCIRYGISKMAEYVLFSEDTVAVSFNAKLLG
jgi:hypothetical protein